MTYFSKLLAEALNSSSHDENYVDPDDLWTQADHAVAFIYNPDGIILYSEGNRPGGTHGRLVEIHRDYYARLLGFRDFKEAYTALEPLGPPSLVGEFTFKRAALIDLCIIGRAGDYPYEGEIRRVASFWNRSPELYEAQLEGCLAKLTQDQVIDVDTVLFLPHLGVVTVGELETGKQQQTEPDQARLDYVAQREQLHTMHPDQKKAALRQLGYQGSTKHPWQQAGEEAGVVQPGHKFWAMTSEGQLWLSR